MLLKKPLIALALSAAIAGCATTPVPSKEAVSVPTQRVLAFQNQTKSATASLKVTRDEGLVGGGCYMALWLNGKLAARFDTSETARFYVEPGEILLRVGSDPEGNGLCGFGKDRWTERETTLKPNENKAFRLTTDANGKRDIERGE